MESESESENDSCTTREITGTIQGVTMTRDVLEPWLDDGNIVLVVEEKCFRVHRTVLSSYSEVFKDMFAVPHSDDTEEDVMDGCPAVCLSDTADDVQIMLRAFYDRSFVFFRSAPMHVSILQAFLRMGKKYVVRQLFEEAKRRLFAGSPTLVRASKLSATWETTLFPQLRGNDVFNFRVMNIAREGGLLSVVAMAVYYCSLVCPSRDIVDGYTSDGEKYTLSAPNQRSCILAQRYLAHVERQMVQTLSRLPKKCPHKDAQYHSCPSAVLSALRSFQDLRCPFSVWDRAWDTNLCTTCRAELRKKHEEMRTMLWKELPAELDLGGCWEDLDKNAGIPFP